MSNFHFKQKRQAFKGSPFRKAKRFLLDDFFTGFLFILFIFLAPFLWRGFATFLKEFFF